MVLGAVHMIRDSPYPKDLTNYIDKSGEKKRYRESKESPLRDSNNLGKELLCFLFTGNPFPLNSYTSYTFWVGKFLNPWLHMLAN